jgi:predicted DNA-binding protein
MSKASTSLTIELPAQLREQAEARARSEGTTLPEVLRAALEEYAAGLDVLEEAEDARLVREIEARISSGEESVSDWSDFEAQLDALPPQDH